MSSDDRLQFLRTVDKQYSLETNTKSLQPREGSISGGRVMFQSELIIVFRRGVY